MLQYPAIHLGNMSMAKWRLIADLYGVEQSDFDKVKKPVLYISIRSPKISSFHGCYWQQLLSALFLSRCIYV